MTKRDLLLWQTEFLDKKAKMQLGLQKKEGLIPFLSHPKESGEKG